MATYSTGKNIAVACSAALHALISDRPITGPMIALVAEAAAHTDHTGVTIVTDDSIVAAVNTVIKDEGLTPRDALLADILLRLTVLETA